MKLNLSKPVSHSASWETQLCSIPTPKSTFASVKNSKFWLTHLFIKNKNHRKWASSLWVRLNLPSVKFDVFLICGLYYKPMTIAKDDSRVVTKLETLLTDNARVIIYDRHMFIAQATDELSIQWKLHTRLVLLAVRGSFLEWWCLMMIIASWVKCFDVICCEITLWIPFLLHPILMCP